MIIAQVDPSRGVLAVGSSLRAPTHATSPKFPGLSFAGSVRLDDRSGLAAALGIGLGFRGRLDDAQLVLEAYSRWGADCPRKLLGDYAFAIADERTRTCLAVRDHIGGRPLYYAHVGPRLLIASTIASLIDEGVANVLDEVQVATYLRGTEEHHSRTLLKAIRRVPSAHSLVVDASGAMRFERYWTAAEAPEVRYSSDEDYREALLELHRNAVADRIDARPTAVHVTGGLDSSGVAAVAARILSEQGRAPPLGYCWQPAELGSSELEVRLIRDVAAHCGIPLAAPQATIQDVIDILRQDAVHYPTEFTLAHETAVQRDASALGIEVILSGWGGDEGISFSGKGRHADLLLKGRLRTLARAAPQLQRTAAGLILGEARSVLREVFPRQRPGPHKPYISDWLAQRVPESADRAPWRGARRVHLSRVEGPHLASRIEGWAHSAAKWGVEYRYPLLDRRILDFACGLPPDQLVRDGIGRYVMRGAMTALLPQEVCWNRDKTEPGRTTAFSRLVSAAVPKVAGLLDDAVLSPDRAACVDISRLRARIPGWTYERGALRPLRLALQFLDF